MFFLCKIIKILPALIKAAVRRNPVNYEKKPEHFCSGCLNLPDPFPDGLFFVFCWRFCFRRVKSFLDA